MKKQLDNLLHGNFILDYYNINKLYGLNNYLPLKYIYFKQCKYKGKYTLKPK